MTWTITKTCGICEHYPYHEHCIGCKWDEGKGENTKWELKKNPIVIERAVLDKIRAEIADTLYVDSLIFGELIDFKNGKISADDVIEEFNRVTRIEVLKIIDKYKAESEEE